MEISTPIIEKDIIDLLKNGKFTNNFLINRKIISLLRQMNSYHLQSSSNSIISIENVEFDKEDKSLSGHKLYRNLQFDIRDDRIIITEGAFKNVETDSDFSIPTGLISSRRETRFDIDSNGLLTTKSKRVDISNGAETVVRKTISKLVVDDLYNLVEHRFYEKKENLYPLNLLKQKQDIIDRDYGLFTFMNERIIKKYGNAIVFLYMAVGNKKMPLFMKRESLDARKDEEENIEFYNGINKPIRIQTTDDKKIISSIEKSIRLEEYQPSMSFRKTMSKTLRD